MHRRNFFLALCASLTGCVSRLAPPGPPTVPPRLAEEAFIMRDGARLPCRVWQPNGWTGAHRNTVVLALHGFNDSRDAWELPGEAFAQAGILLYAPDQRGFGAAPGRGLWPGGQALVDDAAEMARVLRARHPGARLILMGESMGGAVLMLLAAQRHAPSVDGYVMLAPAVWGRADMNVLLRSVLWTAVSLVPGLVLTGSPVRVRASDNRAALIRLSNDPLTIRGTRVDAVGGLVDLMDAALAAAPHIRARALFLYGGKDELVPEEATAATWRGLAQANPDMGAPTCPVRTAYYPNGYHLLTRDLDRAIPTGDVIAWMHAPTAPLPSGADRAAQTWLARQET